MRIKSPLRVFNVSAQKEAISNFGAFPEFPVFGEGVKLARVRLQYLPRPFTRTIANERLRSKQQKEELLHELLRQKTSIAVTPLAESTPSPNSLSLSQHRAHAKGGILSERRASAFYDLLKPPPLRTFSEPLLLLNSTTGPLLRTFLRTFHKALSRTF